MENKRKHSSVLLPETDTFKVSPRILIFIIIFGILAGEFWTMIFLSHHFSHHSTIYVALVDASILSGFVVPLMYFFYYRPTRRLISSLHASLQKANLASNIMEKTAEGMMITNPDTEIIYVNQSFSEITGYLPEDVLGKNPRLLKSGIHDKAFYQDMWRRIHEYGLWQGEIWNRKKTGEVYLESLSISVIRDSSGKIAYYVGILSQSFRDRMTGLANRHLLLEKLKTALSLSVRTSKKVGLLFIDLDGFKAVNDTYGHDVGDQLLQSVGLALKDAVRACDVPARFGGDEFVILLQDIESTANARKVAEQCLEKIRTIGAKKKAWASVTASVGVYVTDGQADENNLVALKKADQAMYEAKKAGKNRIVVKAAAPA